jgi:tripartite-type tricarboxylate transporter receptor subunit TctC
MPGGTRCKASNASGSRSWNQASRSCILRCRPRRSPIRGAGAEQARQLNFGNPGTGSSIDLTAQKLFPGCDIKLTNVGYKGQPPALIDLMTNLMHFEIVSLALALPHIKQGTIKPLAVFTEKRVPDLPDVPTIAEAGYAEAAYVPWYGIYVPSATPDPLIEKIHEAINKALQNPDVQRQLSVADIPGKPMR